MRSCFVRSHSQRSVEQEDALPRPAFEAAVIRAGKNDGGIVQQLFVHVDQRRRGGDAVGHAEAQPVRLPVIVVPNKKPSTKPSW